jgi:hypothetical protein
LTVVILLLVAAGSYRMSRAAPRAWLLLVLFAAPTIIALVATDLRNQTHFALIPRYMLAPWLVFEIVVAYLVASALTASRATRLTGALGLTVLLFAGGLSCLAVVRAPTAPDAAYNADLASIAQIVNDASRPLVVTEDGPDVAHILANLLRNDVTFQLIPTGARAIPRIAPGYNVFALDPSQSMRRQLVRQGFRLQRVFGIDRTGHVWQDSLWSLSRGNGAKPFASQVVNPWLPAEPVGGLKLDSTARVCSDPIEAELLQLATLTPTPNVHRPHSRFAGKVIVETADASPSHWFDGSAHRDATIPEANGRLKYQVLDKPDDVRTRMPDAASKRQTIRGTDILPVDVVA